MSGAIMITGKAAIEEARLRVLRGALRLEMRGLRRRGPSAATLVRRALADRGLGAPRSRADLLAALSAYLETVEGAARGSSLPAIVEHVRLVAPRAAVEAGRVAPVVEAEIVRLPPTR